MTFEIYALSLQERLNAMLDLNHLFENIICFQAKETSDEDAKEYGYASWIDYCHKRNFASRFVRDCPICGKPFTSENYAVGGHVLAALSKDKDGNPALDTECITPICNRCNVRADKLGFFNVKRIYLTKTPPKPKTLGSKKAKSPF